MIAIMIEDTMSEMDTKAINSQEMMLTMLVTELMSEPMTSE